MTPTPEHQPEHQPEEEPALVEHEPPGEPTPWATGLTVTAIVAAGTAALDLAMTAALAASFGWLAIPANVVIAAGLAPSVWLSRRMPVWRWAGGGVVLGLALAWLALLFRLGTGR